MPQTQAQSLKITLYPHRSLNRFGLTLVLGGILFSNLVIAAFCWRYHAWPIYGFLGLDVILVFAAFWLNNRAADRSEEITVDGDEVTLTCVSRKGETRRSFNRRWMRVELEHDAARELVGRLFLVSHGKRSEVASFLGAEEREALARELRRVLA